MVFVVELPGEIIYGEVLLRMYGDREVLIENYKGILLYTQEEIAIACKKLTLRIYGADLHIRYFSGSDMKVTGRIHTITYISNGDLCC